MNPLENVRTEAICPICGTPLELLPDRDWLFRRVEMLIRGRDKSQEDLISNFAY